MAGLAARLYEWERGGRAMARRRNRAYGFFGGDRKGLSKGLVDERPSPCAIKRRKLMLHSNRTKGVKGGMVDRIRYRRLDR